MRYTLKAAVFGLLGSTILAGAVAAGGGDGGGDRNKPSADPFDPPRIYITPDAKALTYTDPDDTKPGIPYRWWITPGPKDQVNFGYYVGALSWWQPTFAPPNTGWTHNSNWVALTLTKTSWVTIQVGPTIPVPCAPPLQPAACDNTGRTGSDLYPAISIYKGQDTTSVAPGTPPDNHVFNPVGNFWATGITYLDSSYKSDRVTHVLVYKKKLPAGKYTIDIGGAGARSPYCYQGQPCYSGGQSYQATITASPADHYSER